MIMLALDSNSLLLANQIQEATINAGNERVQQVLIIRNWNETKPNETIWNDSKWFEVIRNDSKWNQTKQEERRRMPPKLLSLVVHKAKKDRLAASDH